ncbi:phosphoribosylamine--glycine ligase [Thalassobacillus sp. CUG 92003]|uniref:phosphoribosylamine--glycine ligase n=1 Tax=Thalassobacillus sp. CUG 92003 TaxID=2736641 RepID=UPI0015E6B535|nr:phosphoribosylamine--glycine ligase [Thalassobacillus sp. CUG 92003]
MNVMVIGRGGREHSIVQKLSESDRVETIFAVPGNAGMESEADRVVIDESDRDALVDFARQNEVDLTIVGPEQALLDGVVDAFQNAGLSIFGPTQAAAKIEGSKRYAKEIMHNWSIPTGAYQAFSQLDPALAYIEDVGAPIVIKADGLAAGKGVVVAESVSEAKRAAEDMLIHGQFGEASREIVIEEFLEGEEYSLMAFVHEDHVYPMLPAKDHKRAFDQDKGPNTGGMGAFAPVPGLSHADIEHDVQTILQPAAEALLAEGHGFTGILYAGLIATDQGAKVIEFNARFGDPETQVVLPLLDNDLTKVIEAVMDGRNPGLSWKDRYCGGVVVASTGYPGSYDKGVALPDLSSANGNFVHAGTETDGGKYVSAGGRVLLAEATADRLPDAFKAIYQSLAVFDDTPAFFYRKDIGPSASLPASFAMKKNID